MLYDASIELQAVADKVATLSAELASGNFSQLGVIRETVLGLQPPGKLVSRMVELQDLVAKA